MIYFHIPFCKQKCSYCNFHFSTSLAQKEDMLLALHREIDMRHAELNFSTIKTIYFGGGTPSLLAVDEIKALIDHCAQYYDFAPDIEITLEANPDDLNAAFLKALAHTAVNRLSIGTQSFYEPDLKLMNRAHTSGEAEDSIKRAQDMGFENLTIDLIYGASGMEIWKKNLEKALYLQVPHISSYALTVEPKTALDQWIKQGKVTAPDEALQSEEFYYLSHFLKTNGFIHYEISNFAKEGFYSQHNSSYWKGLPYLGLGPSAHSFDGINTRSWNIASNPLYLKGIATGKRNFEEEHLNEKQHLNELVMIGLRTIWGVDFLHLKNNFSEEALTKLSENLAPKLHEGLIIKEDNHLKIPERHWFMADGIASDLFLV